MSAELVADAPVNGIGRPPKEYTLEHMTDAAEFVRLLNRTQYLTDDAYNEIVDDIGARAARLVLRAKALAGDVRALDLYLRVAKDAKRERTERSRSLPAPLGATTFASGPREDTTTNSG